MSALPRPSGSGRKHGRARQQYMSAYRAPSGPTAGRSGAAEPVDPRVERTQRHVLEHARRLLVEEGALDLTFSVLAQRARVSRQTLYRYWSGPDAVVADLIRRRFAVPGEPAQDARQVLTEWLTGMRETLRDPATSAGFGMLMAAAPHSPAAHEALRDLVASRLAVLNERLAGLRAPLDEDDIARLAGPLMYAHFMARDEIDDRLIEQAVAAFLEGGPSR